MDAWREVNPEEETWSNIPTKEAAVPARLEAGMRKSEGSAADSSRDKFATPGVWIHRFQTRSTPAHVFAAFSGVDSLVCHT